MNKRALANVAEDDVLTSVPNKNVSYALTIHDPIVLECDLPVFNHDHYPLRRAEMGVTGLDRAGSKVR